MKAIFLFTALLGVASLPVSAQTSKTDQHLTTAHIKVYGECESCKRRIENTLKIDGIISASWNVDTKLLTLEYDDKRVNTDKVEQLLSSAGHDTEKYRATDKAYSALPSCCHYSRPKS